MSKELFVTSTPHETKLAIVEDDQVVEVYFERENEYTLAGSIYKGKVTRVLPGMQSAFVEVGLERDAFLYVTDFVEGIEEDHDDEEVSTQPSSGGGQQRDQREQRGGGGRDFRERRRHPRGGQQQERRPQNQPSSSPADPIEFGADFTGEEAADTQDETAMTGHPDRGDTDAGNGEPAVRRWRGRRGRRRRGGDRGNQGQEADPHQETLDVSSDSEVMDEQSTQARETDSPADGPQERPRMSWRERREQRQRERQQQHDPAAEDVQNAEEVAAESGEIHAAADPVQREEREEHVHPPVREERPPQPAREQRPPRAQRALLPGESLKKYGGGSAEGTPQAARPQPANVTAAPRPSTLISDPAAFNLAAGGVLAGETIRKYRDRTEQKQEPQKREERRPPRERQGRREERTFSSPVEAGAPENAAEPIVVERAAEMETQAAEQEPRVAQDREGLDEQDRGSYNFAPGAGEVEEELIEDEEQEFGHYGENIDEPEYEDLEEETLDPDEEPSREDEMIAAGEKIAAAFADAKRSDQVAHTEFEDEGEDEEDDAEGEVSELDEEAGMVAGTEEDDADPEDPDYQGRAELRAASGTAGFQQRTEREPRDRGPRDRNRRGGRRGRSGRMPMRSRRNIPRGPVPQINELLKEGQEILVQIAKEPMAKKGARITSHIALPGRFLVFMPTVNHTGVSRKIGSDEERRRLKQILLSEKGDAHGGFIVRTAAAGATEDELRSDIRFLINLWNEIKQRSEASKAPALIYHDLNLVERILRDQVTANFASIWVDSEAEYERILRFAQRFQPSLIKRVKLYSKDTPLFEQFGVQDEINKALKSKVWLKSGGYIVINQTEALVAIDINTGKFVGKTSRLEDTIVKTNIDAIQEIVRQIRLRDLGGIIIIDFIDMDERRNRQKVMQALEEALRADRSPTKVLQFNDFGLVAITRKRVKQSLERTLSTQCTYCTGTGMVKSVTTICNEIYVELRKMHKQLEGHQVMMRVHPEVAKALKENGGRWLTEMEELIGKTIIVKSDPAQHQEQFDIH